jgi:hypothetical protein
MGTLLLLLALQAPGDRWFVLDATELRAVPQTRAAPVRTLRPGDELAELDPPTDELTGRGLPRGWCLAQTIDVPSGRSFSGFLQLKDLSLDPPAPERRSATLRQALEQALTDLEAREKPFADLRGQVLAWRARLRQDAAAPAQVQALSDRLARYMETEITPRAMDAEDFLGELRELGDPAMSHLEHRFEKAAATFRP